MFKPTALAKYVPSCTKNIVFMMRSFAEMTLCLFGTYQKMVRKCLHIQNFWYGGTYFRLL